MEQIELSEIKEGREVEDEVYYEVEDEMYHDAHDEVEEEEQHEDQLAVHYDIPEAPEPDGLINRRRGKYAKMIFLVALAFTMFVAITAFFWDSLIDSSIEDGKQIYLDYAGTIKLTRSSKLRGSDLIYFDWGGQMVGLPYADYLMYKDVPPKNWCKYIRMFDL